MPQAPLLSAIREPVTWLPLFLVSPEQGRFLLRCAPTSRTLVGDFPTARPPFTTSMATTEGLVMTREALAQFGADTMMTLRQLVEEPATYVQVGVVATVYLVALVLAAQLRRLLPALTSPPAADGAHRLSGAARRLSWLIVPLLAIALLRITVDVSQAVIGRSWVDPDRVVGRGAAAAVLVDPGLGEESRRGHDPALAGACPCSSCSSSDCSAA